MLEEADFYSALEKRHGKEIQEVIRQTEVTICGLGGLGSNIAIALSRCGIGKLRLIDFDCVDISNCNRQQYVLSQVGKKKTESLAEIIGMINPFVELELYDCRLSEQNMGEILKDSLFICEAFDDATQKAMLTNYVLEKMPDSFLVGASGMAGYGESNLIHTRKVFGKFYLCGDETNGLETGKCLMAPRLMICAAHQADMILELIIKHGKEDKDGYI